MISVLGEDLQSVVSRAIVENDEVQILHRLLDDTVDGSIEVPAIVRTWYADRNFPYSRPPLRSDPIHERSER